MTLCLVPTSMSQHTSFLRWCYQDLRAEEVTQKEDHSSASDRDVVTLLVLEELGKRIVAEVSCTQYLVNPSWPAFAKCNKQ